MLNQSPALFLDRDGVINHDHGYVFGVEKFDWIDGVFDTVRTANALGCAVIVITNQAGIAKGYYSEQQFLALSEWMKTRFAEVGAPLTAVYYCPYHIDGLPPYNIHSPSRKPGAGMLLQAAREYGIDLNHSVLVGDQESDIVAGKAAGLMQTALFSQENSVLTQADVILTNHAEVCQWLKAVFHCGAP